jgi:hypothetical protein
MHRTPRDPLSSSTHAVLAPCTRSLAVGPGRDRRPWTRSPTIGPRRDRWQPSLKEIAGRRPWTSSSAAALDELTGQPHPLNIPIMLIDFSLNSNAMAQVYIAACCMPTVDFQRRRKM